MMVTVGLSREQGRGMAWLGHGTPYMLPSSRVGVLYPCQVDHALGQVIEGSEKVISAGDHVFKHDANAFNLCIGQGENGNIVNLGLGDESVEVGDVGEVVRRVARASGREGGGRNHHVQCLQSRDKGSIHRLLDSVDPSLEGRRRTALSWPISLRNDSQADRWVCRERYRQRWRTESGDLGVPARQHGSKRANRLVAVEIR